MSHFLNSSEALEMLRPFGFEHGRDLGKVLYSSLKSLKYRDVVSYREVLRMTRLYGDEMELSEIARESLVREQGIEALLDVGLLRSHCPVDVQEMIDKLGSVCEDGALFWELYCRCSQSIMAEICGCNVNSIKWYVKKYGVNKKHYAGGVGYKRRKSIKKVGLVSQLLTKEVVSWDVERGVVLQTYKSMGDASRRTGYSKRSIGRSVRCLGLNNDGTIRGTINGRIKFFFKEKFDEEVAILWDLLPKKVKDKCEIYHTVERI